MKAIVRGLAAIALGAALALSAGCTVRPLMASGGAGSTAQDGGTAAALSSVAIAPVDTRAAQEVRNHLIFLLNGGKGQPEKGRYALDLDVKSKAASSTTVQIGGSNEVQPTAKLEMLTARYVLTDMRTGKPIATGEREISSPFDVPRQGYAALRAERDAVDRAARELAELLRLSLAQDLARNQDR